MAEKAETIVTRAASYPSVTSSTQTQLFWVEPINI